VRRTLQAKAEEEARASALAERGEEELDSSPAPELGQGEKSTTSSPTAGRGNPFSPGSIGEKAPTVTAQRLCSECERKREGQQEEEEQSSSRGLIQPKLTIGEPGDPYEQEADRVAKQVVSRMKAPEIPTFPVEPGKTLQSQGMISVLQRLRESEKQIQLQHERTMLQRITRPAAKPSVPNVQGDFETRLNTVRGGGSPLDEEFRAKVEPAMGADFSGVKVHTDAEADRLNRSLQAKAFTTGQNIFFRQGTYEPGSQQGQELLAHELTHVVQQRKNLSNTNGIQIQLYPDPPFRGLVQFSAVEDISFPIIATLVSPEQYSLADAHSILMGEGQRRARLVSPLRDLASNRFAIHVTVSIEELNPRYREAYQRVRSMRATAEPGRRSTVAGQVRGHPPDITTWQPPNWLPSEIRDQIVRGELIDGSHSFPSNNPPWGNIVIWVGRPRGGPIDYQFYQYFPSDLEFYSREVTDGNEYQARLLRDALTDFNARMHEYVEEDGISPVSAQAIIWQEDIQALREAIELASAIAAIGMASISILEAAPRFIQPLRARAARIVEAVRQFIRRSRRPPSSSPSRPSPPPGRPSSHPSREEEAALEEQRRGLLGTLEARIEQIRQARGNINLFRGTFSQLASRGNTPRPVSDVAPTLQDLLTPYYNVSTVTGGGRGGTGVSTYIESLDELFSIRITHSQVGPAPLGNPPLPRIHIYAGPVSGHGKHVCLSPGTTLTDILNALGI
jgi:hypothetical protein